MKEIGIWGWFGFRNCGDDLLLINTVNEVVSCMSDDSKITVFGDENNLKRLFPPELIHTRNRSASSLIKYAFKSDILIIGPGGIFPSTNFTKLVFYLIITVIMKIRRKKIGYIGVGIGNGMFQRKRDIFLLNLISKLADAFISRSENYLSFTPDIKEKQITLSSDMIFSDKTVYSSQADADSRTVVVALANIFESNTDEIKESFLSEIMLLLEHIVSKGYSVKMVSFTNEKDMELNDMIAQRMGKNTVLSIPFCENPYDTFDLMKDAYACVGMRFHSLVMALSCGIPCLSISYSDKNEDVMSRFELSDYALRFGISKDEYFNDEIMIDGRSLIEKFDDIIENYGNLKDLIMKHKQDMYELSLINRTEIHKLIKEDNNE